MEEGSGLPKLGAAFALQLRRGGSGKASELFFGLDTDAHHFGDRGPSQFHLLQRMIEKTPALQMLARRLHEMDRVAACGFTHVAPHFQHFVDGEAASVSAAVALRATAPLEQAVPFLRRNTFGLQPFAFLCAGDMRFGALTTDLPQ